MYTCFFLSQITKYFGGGHLNPPPSISLEYKTHTAIKYVSSKPQKAITSSIQARWPQHAPGDELCGKNAVNSNGGVKR